MFHYFCTCIFVIIGFPRENQKTKMCFLQFPKIVKVYSLFIDIIPLNQFPSSGVFSNIQDGAPQL